MKEAVKCPHCMHRLFDIGAEGSAEVDIKCPKCRRIVKIEKGDKVRVK